MADADAGAGGELSRDERARLVQLLEGRRLAIAGEMWQPPALTLAGQAFLLQVLANDALDWWAALPIAAAGVLASVTVWVSLAQQREREVLHGEEVRHQVTTHLDWPDPNRDALVEAQQRRAGKSAKPRWVGHPREWGTRKMWMATMACFIAADIAVLVATQWVT